MTISNAQFQAWQDKCHAMDEGEPDRVRAEIAEEFAQHDRTRLDAEEMRRGAQMAGQVYRHADRLPGRGEAAARRDAARADAASEAAIRADIRRELEAETRSAPAPHLRTRSRPTVRASIGVHDIPGVGRMRFDGIGWTRAA